MVTEISAGGVIFRQKSNKLQILVLKDKNNHWTFPKGAIEDDEDKKDAAQREIIEEVGITNLYFIIELTPISYWYKWQNNIIKKTVYYLLFKSIGKEIPKPQKEEGIQDVKWVNIDDAPEIIGYPKTNKPILEEVKKKLYGMD